MTDRITVERISADEVRVSVTADIRTSGDLAALPGAQQNAPEGDGDAGRPPGGRAGLEEFLTVEQAAKVLQASRYKVYALIRTRQLRSIKIGSLRRISLQWIADFTSRQGLGT